jgi:hypothetical protein
MDTSRPDESVLDAQRGALQNVVWHGRSAPYRQLVQAIRRYCDCQPYNPLCAAHSILIDQRALDGLFARYLTDQLRTQEFALV